MVSIKTRSNTAFCYINYLSFTHRKILLENAVLRDPSTYSGRKYSTKGDCSKGDGIGGPGGYSPPLSQGLLKNMIIVTHTNINKIESDLWLF